MTNIDFPQDLYLNEEEINEFTNKLDKMNHFRPLEKINIAIHNDKIFSPKLEEFHLGIFSTEAFNIFIDNNLKDLYPLLEKLYTYYEKLNVYYEFNEDNLTDIENLINIVIDEYEPLLVFHLDERIPFDIKTTYEVYEYAKDKKRFIEYIKSIIESLLTIADTVVGFYEVFYVFSEQLMTFRSKIYSNDLGLTFDDYFLKGNQDILNNKYRKFFLLFLSREIYTTTTFTNVRLLKTKNKVMVESIEFNDYGSFLQYDYYKSLMLGHSVRICRNCKRAFLQTTKAHTVYCDRIYKNTKKTCRQFGPSKFHKEKVENSPIHLSYNRCKKKIDTRLRRLEKRYEEKNKTVPQEYYKNYNRTVAQIIEYKEQALNGEIKPKELDKIYKKI